MANIIVSNLTSKKRGLKIFTWLKSHKLGNDIAKTQIHMFCIPNYLFYYIVMTLIFNTSSLTAFEKNDIILFWVHKSCKMTAWLEHSYSDHFKGHFHFRVIKKSPGITEICILKAVVLGSLSYC